MTLRQQSPSKEYVDYNELDEKRAQITKKHREVKPEKVKTWAKRRAGKICNKNVCVKCDELHLDSADRTSARDRTFANKEKRCGTQWRLVSPEPA